MAKVVPKGCDERLGWGNHNHRAIDKIKASLKHGKWISHVDL